MNSLTFPYSEAILPLLADCESKCPEVSVRITRRENVESTITVTLDGCLCDMAKLAVIIARQQHLIANSSLIDGIANAINISLEDIFGPQ